LTISPSTVGEKQIAYGENLDISMLYPMTAVSKNTRMYKYVRPFEKTIFEADLTFNSLGGRFAFLSAYVHVFLYGRQICLHGMDPTRLNGIWYILLFMNS
jgi:hypothetical protein